MKQTILTFIAVTVSFLLYGQDYKLNGTLTDIVNYQVSGYSVLDTTTGDLNRDSYLDLVVIYKKNNEEETSDVIDNPEYRSLLLYIGQSDGSLILSTQSKKRVLCYDCGGMMGDPFSQVVIKNGYFTVEHYGGSSWRWSRLVTFKYSPNDSKWYLHKDGGDSYHTSDLENIKTEVKTTKEFGRVSFEEFDIYAE